MKKIISLVLLSALALMMFAGCSSTETETTAGTTTAGTTTAGSEGTTAAESEGGAAEGPISVVSREDGSGTRGAFVELIGIEDENGEDMTTDTAEITNSTSVMMTTVAGNKNAIGYISLGSLNDTVKALSVDGAEPTVDNIKSGDYKVSRPFNIVTTGNESEVTKDFISFIMSEEGQKIVEEEGYISQGNEGAYAGTKPEGKITVSGSSSVTPVMEKLKEAYEALNTNATIELQQSDSSTGVKDALSGTSDIGMASRELKESEVSEGAVGKVIAIDGIAVVVNNENPISSITGEDIKGIYTGEITDWSEVSK